MRAAVEIALAVSTPSPSELDPDGLMVSQHASGAVDEPVSVIIESCGDKVDVR